MGNEVLVVQNLNVWLNSEQIIQDLSFTLDNKEVLIILGPNGGGKTTLLRALLGLLPYQGTITWRRKKIGYLPPQESIERKHLPPLTVLQFFQFKHASHKQCATLLHDVGLDREEFLTKQLPTLSTGEFQRVMIAWTLIDNPHVLLLDEPLAGIDIAGGETIYTLLHTLWKQKGLTLILVTHDISFAWKHASRVLCLNKQQICYGDPHITLTADNLKKLYGTGVHLHEHRHT